MTRSGSFAFLTALVAALAIGGVAQAQPVFQLRMAREDEAPGFTRMEFVGGSTDRSGAMYVADTSIVSDEGIERIRVRPTADGLLLVVDFTRQGAARLAAGTSAGAGAHLAILLDSRLVSSAPIMARLTGSRTIPIGLQLPRSSADSIAARILAKWPPPTRATRSSARRTR